MTLTLDHVTILAQGQTLISDFSAQVLPGDVLTVMGPSGCGKSSLLAYVAGVTPDGISGHGSIALNGQQMDTLPTEQRRIGLLYQDSLLFPHMTVLENILFAVPRTFGTQKERHARAVAQLTDVEMAEFAHKNPDTLSGGQRARVSLARVLASQPKALLLDEPFSALDVALRDRMRRLVFSKLKATGLPVILVTHDPEDAQAAGGPVYHLSDS